ncbi:MAG: glutamine synthetase III [Coriobacteriales bacterium]|jgi:glutamine synthetase|nr:glutamine synthetase III [Coriobacteriales bacterium]
MAKISDYYGSLVFNDQVMQDRLPKATYKVLSETVKDGKPLNLEVANVVAHAMKEWAIELGATHYTHWFQPLTGITSEKHDSFINPQPNGRALLSFSGKELIQGEPDASSFPSGGLRATFEARGYTAWDPTSFAFIKDEVLCIPTAFVSYTGEALDKKTPLLRSMDAIGREAKRVLALFGKQPVQVSTTVGPEQEYFLIKEEDYQERLDLILTGRTLFGADPCKGQELEEHYFGAIRPTVNRFMQELDDELWKLGIPAKTKHNEVAPSQHELAPIFLTTNAAVDANLLMMELMRKLASHHGLVCLQHEKPFEGINGNGKHNNWSISADGVNLLDPGTTPFENLQFLVFLTAVIKAVDEYQGLLRMSVASAGNDHRLGANEAPPAIISIFLGDELEAIVRAIIDATPYASDGAKTMDLGSPVLPTFIKDNTDRNRTSPFAFTGNKFEFRMSGGEVNLSDANMVLNTIVAKALADFADTLEESADFETDAKAYMKQVLTDHQRIIFNGNNYDEAWIAEAARRGLLNLKSTPEALPQYITPESVELFERFGVLSKIEAESRYEVKLEHYSKKINIEGLVTARMARARFIPAIIEYSSVVAGSIAAKKAVAPDIDTSAEEDLLTKLNSGLATITKGADDLQAALADAAAVEDSLKAARAYLTKVLPAMNAVRAAVDEMEIIVGHDYWPVPTYNHILFYT